MNEFTKEELDYLLNCVNTDIDIQGYIGGYPMIVKDKLEFMLENYCEHIFIHISKIPECIKCYSIPKGFINEISEEQINQLINVAHVYLRILEDLKRIDQRLLSIVVNII